MFTDDLIDNPVALRSHLAAAEATGRAAVRALAYIRAQADEHIGGENYLVSPGGFYKADAVLATDTARAWLAEQEEGND